MNERKRECACYRRGCGVLLYLVVLLSFCELEEMSAQALAPVAEPAPIVGKCVYERKVYSVGQSWTADCNQTACTCVKNFNSDVDDQYTSICRTKPCVVPTCNKTQVLMDELNVCGCRSCVDGFICYNSSGHKHILQTDKPRILGAQLVGKTVTGNFTGVPCLRGNFSVEQYLVRFKHPSGNTSSLSIRTRNQLITTVPFSHRLKEMPLRDKGVEISVAAISGKEKATSDGVKVFPSVANGLTASPSPTGSSSWTTEATSLTTSVPLMTSSSLSTSDQLPTELITTVQEGDTVVLACPFQQSITAAVYWLHHETSDIHKQATVMLPKVRQQQAGRYTCQVTSFSGKLKQSVSLQLNVLETISKTEMPTDIPSKASNDDNSCSSDNTTTVIIAAIVACILVVMAVLFLSLWLHRRKTHILSAADKPHKKVSADTSVTFSNSSVDAQLTLRSDLSTRLGSSTSHTLRAPEPLPRIDSQQSMASDVFVPQPSTHSKRTSEPIYESGDGYIEPVSPSVQHGSTNQSSSQPPPSPVVAHKNSSLLPLPNQLYSYTDLAPMPAMRNGSSSSSNVFESSTISKLTHSRSEYLDMIPSENNGVPTSSNNRTQENNDYLCPVDTKPTAPSPQIFRTSPAVLIPPNDSTDEDTYQQPLKALHDNPYRDPIDMRSVDSPYEEPVDTLTRSTSNIVSICPQTPSMRQRSHTAPDAFEVYSEPVDSREYALPLDSILHKSAGGEARPIPLPRQPSPQKPFEVEPKVNAEDN